MSGVLICFLIGCMLHDSLCQRFAAFVPQSMEVLRGSCLTIPCSFTIQREFNNNLDNTCKGIWKIGGTNGEEVFNPSSNKPQAIQRLTGTLTGNLNNKDCTTILNNMDSSYSGDYYFRLQCNNALKYDFGQQHLKVLVKEEPPKPTLTQDPVNVSEGSPVRLRCSAAVPCSSLPPTLTWTPRLANTEEKLMENEDKTKVLVSDMTFTASHIHHGLEISCAVLYKRQSNNRALTSNTHITVHVQYPPRNTTVSVSPSATVQEGRTVNLTCSSTANPAVNEYTWYTFIKGNKTVVGSGSILTFNQTPREKSGLYYCEAKNVHGKSNATVTLNIEFAPDILPSSGCIRTGDQIRCFCDSVGAPSPTTLWKLDGQPVNQSDTFTTGQEPLKNDTGLRSFISISQSQRRQEQKGRPTVVCLSSNSLGSASHHFCVRCVETQGLYESTVGQPSSLLLFIVIAVLAALLVCALVFAKRAHQKQRNNPPHQVTGMSSNAVRRRASLTDEEGNEVCGMSETEDIYVNCLELRGAGQQNTHSIQNPDLAAPNPGPEPPSSSTTNLPSSVPVDQSDVIYSSVIWKNKKNPSRTNNKT